MEILYMIGAGLVGVLGHWYARYSQNRCQKTFWAYIMNDKASTIRALFAIVAACTGIYQGLGEGYATKELVMALLTSYTTGYTLDSVVNRDTHVHDAN